MARRALKDRMTPASVEAHSIPIPPPPSGLERLGRVWRQLRRNRLSLVGSLIVVSLLLLALAAPFLGLPSPVKLNIAQRFL
ncbi:MAG: hypothetical protein MUE65_04310, partial [Methanomassiliicoccales archaeon]|nr:hypothetical protein [Methanomassiliicoccales archaeon]